MVQVTNKGSEETVEENPCLQVRLHCVGFAYALLLVLMPAKSGIFDNSKKVKSLAFQIG